MTRVRTVVEAGAPGAARALTARLAAEHTGRPDIAFTQTCAECGGPHGRPVVVGGGAHVGWSRTSGVVAAVVADRPCAIDVESLGPLRTDEGRSLPLDLLPRTEREWVRAHDDQPRAFARLWVRKELLVKLGDLTLDEAVGTDVRASLEGRPVLGRTLVELDATPYDAVAAWAVDETS